MKRPIAILMFAMGLFLFSSPVCGQTGRPWTAPKTGVWTITAKDEGGVSWSGRLHLKRTSTRGARVGYRGHFYWLSGDRATSGNEDFTGSFDRSSGRLRLHGYRVRNVRGELGTGEYRAAASRGTRLLRGTWSGEDSVPGTWSARWRRSH